MNFHLFAKPVHPELLTVCGSRFIERDQYRLWMNITTDGHLLTFQHRDLLFCEVAAAASHPLPSEQKVISHLIEGTVVNGPQVLSGPVESAAGSSAAPSVEYQSTVSIETVDPKIFVTIQRQLDKRVETDGLVHRFESNGRLNFGAISYMHARSFINHIRVRAFHTFPETGAVLKTDTVFRVPPAVDGSAS